MKEIFPSSIGPARVTVVRRLAKDGWTAETKNLLIWHTIRKYVLSKIVKSKGEDELFFWQAGRELRIMVRPQQFWPEESICARKVLPKLMVERFQACATAKSKFFQLQPGTNKVLILPPKV